MELEFRKTSLEHYISRCDTVCTREETLEMIVPDACPDILQVLDTCAFCALKRRETGEGSVRLSGSVRVVILYLPEGREGVWKLEAELPFQHSQDCVGVLPADSLLAQCRVSLAETRILNPRKILIRVSLSEHIRVFGRETLYLCSEIEDAHRWGIQQKLRQESVCPVICVAERPFVWEEEVTLPVGKNAVSAVLRSQAASQITDSHLVNGKLLIKGEIALRLLCRGQDGELFGTDLKLPFSQLLDTPGAGEDALCIPEIQITDWQTGSLSSDGRSLPFSCDLLACAVVTRRLTVALTADAYSISYPITPRVQTLSLPGQSECIPQRQNIREFLETELNCEAVCGCHMEGGQPSVRLENEMMEIEVPLSVTVLIRTEEGKYAALHREFSETLRLPPGKEGQLRCGISLSPPEALPAASGLEVRGALDVTLRQWETRSAEGLVHLELDEEHPLDQSQRPSVILRRVKAGEELWSIARSCCTTCEEICAANGMGGDEPLEDRLLLIPRKR